MSDDTTAIGRRTVLKAAAGAATAGAGLSAAGTAAAQPTFGGWMDGANNYDGVVDRTGKDSVTIEVGAGSTGLAFGPAAVRIDPGTTVEWKWTGQGGQHNVHAMEGADFKSDLYSKSGVHFSHTFEKSGIVKYQCDPHAAVGMKGVVVVGDVEVGGGSGGTATPTSSKGATPTATSSGGKTKGTPDFGGWLSDANNYDGGVTDLRGKDSVTIEVGAGSTGLAFGPAAVWIDTGTTVTWKWTGKGGQHNVHAQEGASFESDLAAEQGYTFEHTFESAGIVTYQCDPHAAVGMKGAIAVGDDVPTKSGGGGSGGGGGGRPAFGGYVADANVGSYRDARGQDTVTVTVGAGNGLAFDPTKVWVDPGTTIKWKWTGKGGAHNVVSKQGPASFDSGEPVSGTGVKFEHTFEETGITTYYCEPHEAAGMRGAVAVGDDVPMAGAGGSGGGGLTIPTDQLGSLLLGSLFGVAGLAAALVLATETYGAIRSGELAIEEEAATTDEEVVREIGHDEFDPWGTASLIAIYFAIILGLWLFMYFVEFLNNGPTVIG